MNNSTATAVKETHMNDTKALMFADLLSSQLEGVEGTEVIVSITTVPPQTTLPLASRRGVCLYPRRLTRLMAGGQTGRNL